MKTSNCKNSNRQKHSWLLPFALVASLLSGWPARAMDFNSVTSGNWSDPNTWWVPSRPNIPGPADNILIYINNTVTGAGTVNNLDMNSGTLNTAGGTAVCTGPGSVWMNGTLNGNLYQPNTGELALGGVNTFGNGNVENQGLIALGYTPGGAGGVWPAGINSFVLTINSGSYLQNDTNGVLEFSTNGWINGSGIINNYGLIRATASSVSSTNSAVLNNLGGTVEVDNGTLVLMNNVVSANGTFNVVAGATLDVTGGQTVNWSGTFGGTGAGQVQFNSGTMIAIAPVTLNFPTNLFQWTGGRLADNAGTVNTGFLTVAGPVALSGGLNNLGTIFQTGSGSWSIFGGYGGTLVNQAGGVYNLKGDSGLSLAVNNYGLFQKSGGTGTSTLTGTFNNYGGTIEVDSGTLLLGGGGSSSNGTFNVAAGATLDVTGGQTVNWSGTFGGTGAGRVQFNGGTMIAIAPVTLNFPTNLFQWTGGIFSANTLLVNTGFLTITGPVQLGGGLNNLGTIFQTGSGSLAVFYGDGFGTLVNQAGGVYNLKGDSGFSVAVNNYGLLQKSGGTGTSTLTGTFNNYDGNIEVDSGVISLNGQGYAQGGGSFIVTLGGTNSGQSGQLVCGAATLGGPLQVKLAGGYVPGIRDQIQILSCSSRSGTFSSLNVPQGFLVVYARSEEEHTSEL